MKYIRIKEGKIIDIDKRYQEHLNDPWHDKKIKSKQTFIKISHHNIVKQADTIEELCDGYVLVYKIWSNIKPNILTPLRSWTFKDARRFAIEEESYLFACIWVIDSNGAPTLKPVAKMNEKGDLELL